MEILENENLQNFTKIFYCNICNISMVRKQHYEKHILTAKHKRKCFGNENYKMEIKSYQSINKNVCKCGKSYSSYSGLWKHKKKCQENQTNNIICEEVVDIKDYNSEQINNKEIDYKSMFFEMVKENNEFKNLLVSQQEQMNNYIKEQNNKLLQNNNQLLNILPKVGNINNINNTQNNKFNINVSLQDLNYSKQEGLANGIINIILENMNKLTLFERPIHCIDTKREILYVKDNNIWEKDITKDKIKKALKDISSKQIKTFKKWCDNHDLDNNEDYKDEFVRILNIITKSVSTIDNKIIKKICNNSYVKELLKN
jgi:hypothetical protein